MFEIGIIIVSRLLLVYLGFCVYRRLSGWQGINDPVIGRSNSFMIVPPGGQRGFLDLGSKDGDKLRIFRTVARKDIRAPWGW